MLKKFDVDIKYITEGNRKDYMNPALESREHDLILYN
jgi:hypothetical protein